MPTYDYVCNACEHAFEEFQSITAKPLRKCPQCGKLKLQRLIGTGAGIIFKGSGFYETDYRSDSYSKGQKAEADASKPKETKTDKAEKSGSSTTKSESKSDRKPAAKKPESKPSGPKESAKPKV